MTVYKVLDKSSRVNSLDLTISLFSFFLFFLVIKVIHVSVVMFCVSSLIS